jgi:hypothetical protein
MSSSLSNGVKGPLHLRSLPAGSTAALWKFNWFLRDFGYDIELLGRDEVDETQLIGLTGVNPAAVPVANLIPSKGIRRHAD